MARGISTEWKTIAPGESQLYPQFVNEDTLFLSGTNRRSLIRTDGKILLEERNEPRLGWGAGCGGTRALPSANGRRLVVPSCQTKGAVAGLDIGGHSVLNQIHIYEIGSEIQWKVLDVKGPRIQDEMEFAVSPDGSKLAVLNNQFVQVFELPPQ